MADVFSAAYLSLGGPFLAVLVMETAQHRSNRDHVILGEKSSGFVGTQ